VSKVVDAQEQKTTSPRREKMLNTRRLLSFAVDDVRDWKKKKGQKVWKEKKKGKKAIASGS